jgi:hypothetical protein
VKHRTTTKKLRKMGSVLPVFEQRLRTTIGTWSPVKKLAVCIVPVALLLAIPIVVALLRDGKTSDGTPRHTVAGVDEKRFFIWIEASWLGFWACKGVVDVFATLRQAFISPKEPQRSRPRSLLDRLAFPIALGVWSISIQLIFAVVGGTTTLAIDG